MTNTNIELVLEDRESTHGRFSATAALAQAFKHLMHRSQNWEIMPPHQKEALEGIATKLARILAGNADHADHWRDVQGYARLVEEKLLP